MDVHFTDADGVCLQTLSVDHPTRTEDAVLAELTASAAKQGRTAIRVQDADGHVCKAPTKTPEMLALDRKATRLAALRTKGWTNLTAAERDEANGLRFDLGI